MPFRPVLRPHVRIEAEPEGGLVLRDSLVGFRIQLSPLALRVSERLDGQHDLEQLAHGEPPLPPKAVEAVVRRYLLLNLLEGAGDGTVARLQRFIAGELELPFSVLREGRFGCQASGDCCHSYRFGPLMDTDVARIEALDVRSALPQVGELPLFHELVSESGQRQKYLNTIGEHCLFLLEDERCGLHAAFGPESKPYVCRRYPYVAWTTIDGIKIYDRGECSCFSSSARSGTPVVEDLERVIPLLPPIRELNHPSVLLDEGLVLDFGHFLKLQKAAIDLLAEHPGPAEASLRTLAGLVQGFSHALAACPLQPGEPDATVARVLTDPRLRITPPAASEEQTRRGAAALAQLCGALSERLAHNLVRDPQNPREVVRLRRLGQLLPLVHGVQAWACCCQDPEAFGLSDYYRELSSLETAQEVYEVLRISFRQSMFGSNALVELSARAGLLRLALAWLVTLFGGRLQARAENLQVVSPRHLDHGHVLAQRLLHHPLIEEIILAHQEHTWDVFAALPQVAGGFFKA